MSAVLKVSLSTIIGALFGFYLFFIGYSFLTLEYWIGMALFAMFGIIMSIDAET